MERQKIIVDCDGGTDDALALILLLKAHKQKKIEIMAITCVTGNTDIDNVINNVFRVLYVCNALEIPVYKGINSPLLSTDKNFQKILDNKFHGADGFCDVFTDKPDTSKIQEEHAVCALQRITKKYNGEVILLCLGPLTNIALVIKMYPQFVKSVKKFVIMGGNISAIGNITSQAEFNFYADPESAHIVISNATKKLWLFPWETCLKLRISQEWRNNVFGKIDTPVVKFINAIEANIYSPDGQVKSDYIPCDAFAAAVILDPNVIKDSVMNHIDVELNGSKTRGQVVIDHLMLNKPNANIIQDISSEIFKNLLLSAVNLSI